MGYLAHGKSKNEARGRNRHKKNSQRGVRNMEERNVGTIRGKGSKRGLTRTRIQTIMLPEGLESPYSGAD